MFVDGKTYDYVNNKVITVPNNGDSYFMPLVSLAIGYDLEYKNSVPALKIYLKPFYFGQFPMNQIMVPNIGLKNRHIHSYNNKCKLACTIF